VVFGHADLSEIDSSQEEDDGDKQDAIPDVYRFQAGLRPIGIV